CVARHLLRPTNSHQCAHNHPSFLSFLYTSVTSTPPSSFDSFDTQKISRPYAALRLLFIPNRLEEQNSRSLETISCDVYYASHNREIHSLSRKLLATSRV
ncbi:unnamed protein product, partial [Ectocarpus sp. 12 AP-2014]